MKKSDRDKRFLKKGKLSAVRIIFSRTGMIVFFVLLQFLFFVAGFALFAEHSRYFWIISLVFALIMLFFIINSRSDPTAKLTWAVIVLISPIFGGPFYFFIQSDIGHRKLKKRYKHLAKENTNLLNQDKDVIATAEEGACDAIALRTYLSKSGCYPLHYAENVRYLPSGESKLQALLTALKQAEKFIFLEYFIIQDGSMWGQVLDVLIQKASEGVEVRLLYDGTCEFSSLPRSYPRKLAKYNIACNVFSPIKPFFSTQYNYRDHRKIAIIDGKVAITGGINLADEYINEIDRFGHWKDSAILFEGRAVNNLTVLFLETWSLYDKTVEYTPYLNTADYSRKNEGYILPFGDCPLDEYKAGETVYIDILNRAERYVHIMTPYLILDGSLETAVKFAAERGVEVKIIIPGIPDKKIPYALARTHFASLMDSGVKIYEYSPGFVHSKVCVSDGKKAVVGTINYDYRSFYHHFECAAYMQDVPCIADIELDFESTLAKCEEITQSSLAKHKGGYALLGALLKLIAPLL